MSFGKGEATCVIAGAQYRLRCDVNALAHYESATNCEDILAEIECLFGGERLTFTKLRALVHACLQAHHPFLDLIAVGNLMSEGNQMLEAMAKAVANSMPKVTPGDVGNAPPTHPPSD
jgi:hypothetical protein